MTKSISINKLDRIKWTSPIKSHFLNGHSKDIPEGEGIVKSKWIENCPCRPNGKISSHSVLYIVVIDKMHNMYTDLIRVLESALLKTEELMINDYLYIK